ncbi:hypothetical protein HK104_010344 [Borealophlyctis nickersoniae]|nr:hypothetical protein HK104_010344 [Borealophlyctis nickersoniae]
MSSKEQQPHSKDALIAHDKESNHSMVSYIQSQLERKVERAIDTRTYTHFFKEFGVFLGKRNLVDTGLGIIIGSAFSSAVQALVDDLFTPLLGLIFVLRAGHLQQKARAAGRSFAYVTMEDAMKDGAVTLNVGHAVQAVLRFLAIGVAVFGLWRDR